MSIFFRLGEKLESIERTINRLPYNEFTEQFLDDMFSADAMVHRCFNEGIGDSENRTKKWEDYWDKERSGESQV